jgi:peptidyl-prolyl cis-trans isomerase B (cyclophilin B)
MRTWRRSVTNVAGVLFIAGCEAAEDMTPTVVLETNMGEIVLELDREKAPNTVENFLVHVTGGFYEGLTFHRVRAEFMIQAGRLTADMQRRTSQVQPLQSESENGLKNFRGTLGMARSEHDPHSATSEFFINIVDNPHLDFFAKTAQGRGYTVFGRVVAGMDVVDSISAVPVVRRGQYEALPVEPVLIQRAYVAEEEQGSE